MEVEKAHVRYCVVDLHGMSVVGAAGAEDAAAVDGKTVNAEGNLRANARSCQFALRKVPEREGSSVVGEAIVVNPSGRRSVGHVGSCLQLKGSPFSAVTGS